jgi:predicted nuclease with TOPRIM domain
MAPLWSDGGIEMNDHIPDLTKMISDTPRMDLALRKAQEDCTESYLLTEGRKLERELNAANDRIKRLDETLEAITDKIDNAWGIYMEFKEPKP